MEVEFKERQFHLLALCRVFSGSTVIPVCSTAWECGCAALYVLGGSLACALTVLVLSLQGPSLPGQPGQGKKIGHRSVDASGETTYKKVWVWGVGDGTQVWVTG